MPLFGCFQEQPRLKLCFIGHVQPPSGWNSPKVSNHTSPQEARILQSLKALPWESLGAYIDALSLLLLCFLGEGRKYTCGNTGLRAWSSSVPRGGMCNASVLLQIVDWAEFFFPPLHVVESLSHAISSHVEGSGLACGWGTQKNRMFLSSLGLSLLFHWLG